MKKRILWLDFGKGISIFLVVVAHVLANMSNNLKIDNKYMLSLIHWGMYVLFLIIMPIFFALSGYLFKRPQTKKEYLRMLKKKLIVLGIPYVIFSILLVLMSFKMHVDGVKNVWSLLLIPIYPIGYLWFLNALFFCFLVVGFFELINMKSIFQYIIYIVVALVAINISSSNNIYYLLNNFSWMLCFYIGYQIKEKNFYLDKTGLTISMLIFLLSISFQVKTDPLWYVRGDFFTYANFLGKIFSIFILMTLFRKVNLNNKIVKYFEECGKLSLIIYLVHVPIISILRKVLGMVGVVNNLFLTFIIILVVSWELSIFLGKIINKLKPIDIIFYPNRYIKL